MGFFPINKVYTIKFKNKTVTFTGENSVSKFKSILCLNCNKMGHLNKYCKYPVNSYGIIVFRTDYKIGCFFPRFLMVQKRHSYSYVEIVYGKCLDPKTGQIDIKYLISLIKDLPLSDRWILLNKDFKEIWGNLWTWDGDEEYKKKLDHLYTVGESLFESLKKGVIIDNVLYNLSDLFVRYKPNRVEPEWEFPKGKRNIVSEKIGESDLACAIRECSEETNLTINDFVILLNVKPFQENFTANNYVTYRNSYYIAHLVNPNHIRTYIEAGNTLQAREVRKIGWFTAQEVFSLLTKNQYYRNKMFFKVNEHVQQLLRQGIFCSQLRY